MANKTIKAIILAGLILAALPVSASLSYASEDEEAQAPKPEFEYMEMKPLVLPIITERGLTQQVSMVVSLEMPYGKKAEIEPYGPRLADAYLQDLYGALGSGHAMMIGDVVDVAAVKQRLTDVTTKILGPDRISNVLLQVVQQRPM